MIAIVESTVGLLLKIPIWLYFTIVLPVFGFLKCLLFYDYSGHWQSWLALPVAYFCI